MFKKIDKTLEGQAINGELRIKYSPSLGNEYKVKNAIMRLKFAERTTSGTLTVKCDGKIIDKTMGSIDANDYFYINITEELIDVLNQNKDELIVTFHVRAGSLSVNIDESSVLIDYMPSNLYLENSAYNEFDVKRSGRGKINLATGQLRFKHTDAHVGSGALSVELSHVYGGNLVDNKNDILIKRYLTGYGKGWKINAQQYLIKECLDGFDGDDSVKLFKYIDGNGEVHIFKEQYYYKDGYEKKYISPSQVTIDENQELVYKTTTNKGKELVFKVEKKVLSSNGAELTSKLEDFKEIEYIKTNIDDIETLKDQISSIERSNSQYQKSIEQNNKSKEMLVKANDLEKRQFDIKKSSNDLEEEEIKYSFDLKDKQNVCTKQQELLQFLQLEFQKKQSELQSKEIEAQKQEYSIQNKQIDIQNLQLEIQALQCKQQQEEIAMQTKQLEIQKKQLQIQKGQLDLQDVPTQKIKVESIDKTAPDGFTENEKMLWNSYMQETLHDLQIAAQQKQIELQDSQLNLQNKQNYIQARQIDAQTKQIKVQKTQANISALNFKIEEGKKVDDSSLKEDEKKELEERIEQWEKDALLKGKGLFLKEDYNSFKEEQKDAKVVFVQDNYIVAQEGVIDLQEELITLQSKYYLEQKEFLILQEVIYRKQQGILPTERNLLFDQYNILDEQEKFRVQELELLCEENREESDKKQSDFIAAQEQLICMQNELQKLQESIIGIQSDLSAKQNNINEEQEKLIKLQNKINELERIHAYGNEEHKGIAQLKKELLEDNKALLTQNIDYSSEHFEHQMHLLDNENALLNENLEYNNINLVKLKRQLNSLYKQVPVHYLTTTDGRVLGFGETGKSDDEGMVYRLVMVFDQWENTISIKYNNNEQISQIEGENGIVALNYDEKSGNLTEIIDGRGRKTLFKYAKDCLVDIVYPDGYRTTYTYNSDDQLSQVISCDGTGVSLSYDNSRIAELNTISTTLGIEHNKIISDPYLSVNNSITFKYTSNRATTVTDEVGVETTYLFDIEGKLITVYNKKAGFDNVQAKSFSYDNGKMSYSVSPVLIGEDYLKDSCYYTSDNKRLCHHMEEAEAYLGNNFSGDNIIDNYSYVLSHYAIDDSSIKQISPSEYDVRPYIVGDVTQKMINEIRHIGRKDLVLSAWAKADSASIIRRCTQFSNCEITTEPYDDLEKEFYMHASSHQKSRRFELRAEVTYINGDKDEFYASFDWKQQEWQYCVLPIVLRENKSSQLQGISVYFDYSNNTNTAQIRDMSLKEGEWIYNEYNSDGQKTYEERSDSEFVTEYEYDNNKLIKSKLVDNRGNENIIKYDYNHQNALVRTIYYNGIVNENEYNEKGIIIKSVTYHKDEPSSKFYNESLLDEKGNEIGELNEFGDKISDFTNSANTDLVNVVTDSSGNQIAYGYDYNSDKLLSISSSIEGQQNANISGYTADMLTKLTHNGFDIDYEYDGFGRQTRVTIAGKEYLETKYEKDKDENVTKTISYIYKSDEEKETIEALSNFSGNVIETKYNGQTNVRNIYDIYDRLVRTDDVVNNRQHIIAYDKNGNENKREYIGYGKKFAVATTYNEQNNVDACEINFDGVVYNTRYLYDDTPDNKIVTVTLPNNVYQIPKYDKLGRMSRIELRKGTNSFGKDIYYKQVGDHTSELVASEWFEKDGIIKDRLHYTYDEKGNIIAVTENNVEIVRYTYDSLSRLVREDNKKLDKTTIFTYDNGGNIISRVLYKYSLAAALDLENGNTYIYEYAAKGWRDQLLSYNGAVCGGYDNIGNPGIYRGKTLSWSHGRQLDRIGDITYQYNANGVRIAKTANGVTTKFYVDGTTIIAQESENNLMLFTRGIDGLNGFSLNGTEYFYKKNIQGDIIAIMESSGNEIVRYVYDAWGNHKAYVLANGEYVEISAADNSVYAEIAQLNPYRYRGYYFDIETGLYYLNTRYYDSEVGRFINADDISEVDVEQINGLNLYAYCVNNPILYVDPNGNALISFLVGLLIAGIVGAILNVAGTLVSDLVTSALSGEWSFSSWETYLGSAIGGFAGGVVAVFNPYAGIVVGNTIGTFVGYAIGKATGSETMSWGEIGIMTAISFGVSLLVGGLTQYAKIPGVTKGSHSWQQIFKSGLKNSWNTAIKNTKQNMQVKKYNMHMKTLMKGFGYLTVSGISIGFIASNVIQGLINRTKNIFV